MTVIAVVIFAAAVFFIVNEVKKHRSNVLDRVVAKHMNSFNFNRQTVANIKQETKASDLRILSSIDRFVVSAQKSNVEFNNKFNQFAIPAYTY